MEKNFNQLQKSIEFINSGELERKKMQQQLNRLMPTVLEMDKMEQNFNQLQKSIELVISGKLEGKKMQQQLNQVAKSMSFIGTQREEMQRILRIAEESNPIRKMKLDKMFKPDD